MDYKVFGCKVNQYYLNQRLQYFRKTKNNKPNSVIIASCEVTDRAKNKWLKEVLSYLNIGKHVYLTGCGSIQKGDKVSDDMFFEWFPQLERYRKQITLLSESPWKFTEIQEESEYLQDLVKLESDLTRKPVIIQTGCDNYCTFCLTIYKRGGHQSRPLLDIINEINRFYEQGGKEIVITGINLAAWGCDNSRNFENSKFTYLLKNILQKTKIPRIRISSLGPEYLDEEFFDVVQDSRFMKHFHFSIQSFSDKILKNMKRHYDSSVLDNVLTKIRFDDEVSIGADIIVGFPGETETEFMKTYNAISKYNITKLHAFPFSEHLKGQTVPASKLLGQIPYHIRKENNQKLIKLGDQVREEFIASQRGKTFQVLLEQEKNDFWQGWTNNYIQVQIPGKYKKNDIIEYSL